MSEGYLPDKRLELDFERAVDLLPQFMTDTDLRRYLGHNFPIFKYSELDDIQHINHILPEDKCCCIILVESEHNTGHFVALARKGDVIIQFDSYGVTIDHELNYVTKMMQRILGAEKNALKDLIKNSGLKTIYNKTKYQSTKKIYGVDSAICGRACIIFCQLFKLGYTLEEMKILIDNKRDHYEMIFMTEFPIDLTFCFLIP
jgi:hypothetical protein